MASSLDNLFDQEENERAKMVREFFSAKDENINFKTDLDNEEISLIAKLELQHNLINQFYGIETHYLEATRLFKELKISHRRKGRKEWVEVAKPDQRQDDKSGIRKILGL